MLSIIGSIAVLIVIVAFISWLIYTMIRDKRRGRSSCGCGCESCPMSAKCHGDSKEK